MKQSLLLSLGLCLLTATSFARTRKLSTNDVRAISMMMAGEYSSTAQATADAEFSDLTLHIAPIFQKRKGEYWLYVEQAMTNDQTQPYRQRVYHLYLADDSTVATQVFDIRNPQRFAGAWGDTKKQEALTLFDLENRLGCIILVRKQDDGTWTGSTSGRACQSSVQGSTYATSEVSLYPEKMMTWDRGWNAQGTQTWGAEKGGYEFVKSVPIAESKKNNRGVKEERAPKERIKRRKKSDKEEVS